MNMRQLLLLFGLIVMMSACGTAKQNSATMRDLNPDEVFTITEDDIARETRQVNAMIKGEWTYNAPSVDVSGRSFLDGLGKPIAKSKLKKKLKNA